MWRIFLIIIPITIMAFWFSYQFRVKGRIELIHESHRKNVAKENVQAYLNLMGLAMSAIGMGFIAIGIVGVYYPSFIVMLIMPISLLIAFILANKAQKKYNGCWFSK